MTAVLEPAGVIRSLVWGIKQGIGADDLPPCLFLWRGGSPFGWVSGPTSQAVLSGLKRAALIEADAEHWRHRSTQGMPA